MSHYHSKGDRSEVQLKKAGRSSGPGHQRSGAPSTAIKGGGAGGPSPSGSAPPASGAALTNSQSFSAVRPTTPGTSGRPTTPGTGGRPTTPGSAGRPTTPGSSANRGGKRANGPAGLGRNAQSGGFPDHGGNYRNPHHTGAQYQSHQPQQQEPASAIRQAVGPADANSHTSTSTVQKAELKQATPALQSSNSFVGSRASGTSGAAIPSQRQPSHPVVSSAAAKPPAPAVPPAVPPANAAVPEPASPVATGDNVRASTQPSFSFQFGSISPGFMTPVPGMQIPARTSSAPPNLDEQKRELARFESSHAVVPKKVPTVPSGQQQVQVTGAVGNASEHSHPVLQANQNATSQGLITGAGTPVVQPASVGQPHGLTQQPMQLPQRQGHVPQHSQAAMHMPASAQVPSQHFQQQFQLVQAQAQAQAQAQHVHQVQAHAQQQQQQQQQLQPQQQQAVLSQQALPQQSLPQQALGVQSLSQGMKYPQSMMPPHGPQIISQQMGGPLAGQVSPQMAHQLGPPMGGPMGGQLPPGISGAQYGAPNTGQFIQPQPSRAVKIVDPTTNEEVRFDAKAKKEPFMDSGAPTSSAAASVRVSSNGPQSRPVNYSGGPHHQTVNYYPYTHAGHFNYQPGVPPKSVPGPGGPPANPSRYPYGQQPHRHMNVPGATSNPPSSKGVPSSGISGVPTGQAGIDISNSNPPSSKGVPSIGMSGGPTGQVGIDMSNSNPPSSKGVPSSGMSVGATGQAGIDMSNSNPPSSKGVPSSGMSIGPTGQAGIDMSNSNPPSSKGVPSSGMSVGPTGQAGIDMSNSNPPSSKGVPSSGMSVAATGQAGMDSSNSGAAPLVVSTSGGPSHPIIQPGPAVLSGRPAVPVISQSSGGHTPASNGRISSSVPGSSATSSSAPPTPTTTSGALLKFGDVEASSSAGSVASGESPPNSASPPPIPSSDANGAPPSADPAALHQSVPASSSEGTSARKDLGSKTIGSNAMASKPSVSVPPSKLTSTSSATSVTSPSVAAVPSSVPPISGDKPKIEIVKPTIIRENSRKISKKEQKQHKQQQQQPVPPVAVSVESEVDKKGEVSSTPSTSVGAGNSQVPTSAASGAIVQSGSPRVSHPHVQLSNTGPPIKRSTSFGKSEEAKGTSKAPDIEKRGSGKLPGLSPQNSEVSVSSASILSSEVEEVVRKPSKQVSGKSLSTSKSFEGKDAVTIDSSMAKGGVSSKLNSSSKALLSVPAVKEPIVGQSVDSSPKELPGVKLPPASPVLSNSNRTGDDVLEKPVVSKDATGGIGSATRMDSEVDDSSMSGPIVPPNHPLLCGISSLSEDLSKADRDPSGPEVVTRLGDVSDLDTVASKDVDIALDSLGNGRVAIPEQVGVDTSVDNGVSIVKDTTASTKDFIPDEASTVEKEVVQEKEPDSEPSGIADESKVELTASNAQPSSPVVSEIEAELGSEDISLSTAVETEKSVVDSVVAGPESILTADLEGASDGLVSYLGGESSAQFVESGSLVQENVETSVGSLVESGNQPSLPEICSSEEIAISQDEMLPNGQLSDDRVFSGSASTTISELQSENGGTVDEQNSKEISEDISVGSNPNVEADNLSSSIPEVKQVGSKKKKKKEIYAKADAQGSTGDLFTAYKAPEEKKLDEVKREEAPGSANHSTDTKKDAPSSFEKPVLKEIDDWEDAAELPTPKIAPLPATAAPIVSLVPGEVPTGSDSGVKKYTKDYLLSQKDFHRDLPLQFEIRADLADILLNTQLGAGFTDSLPSPGRNLDRQSSGGPRLDRRNSTVGAEEDRWTRNASIGSPGRGPSDGRMDMGMGGPPGGFRPGQGNTGLMRMPPGMRPGMGAPGIMPPGMGGILPGGPLLPMMMPPGPGRNVSGIDADRWGRAPVGQKGLIPSPRTPLPAIHKTENRYQVGKISDEEQSKQRLVKGILNKLTPQNFDKLFAQVKEVNIDSATTLTGVISQIFDKALTEPTFCEMYARFCVQLAVELPEFVEDEEKITFKRVLLNKCQEEFERGEREQEEAEKVEEEGEVKLTHEEREEKRTSARRRMLGNIRFIGELYKKNMLTERIMHECIKKLLGEYQNPDEEDVEALCKLMSTIGRIIDHPKAKEHIDAYFKRMEKLSENMKLSSRLRFMLKDVIDLRRNGWTERRKVEGPKKIDEVHRDAVQERQQAAASSRDRPQQRGGMGPGGRRPGNDFGIRGPSSPMYSPGGPMGGMGVGGGMRGSQPPTGPVRGGFGQDVRMEARLMMPDSRPMPMPLSQRPDEGLTLGPHGSLGKGMAMRQPIAPGRSALADVPPMIFSDARRPGMGPVPGFGGMNPDRVPYGGREELMRGHGAERPVGSAERPLLERPLGPQGPSMSLRDLRGIDRPPLERPRTPPTLVAARPASAAALPLSDEDLKKKSISTLTEYFSVRDMKEAAQCVEELKNPKFHPKMVSIWVSEALDKKETERELLVKLLIYICKEKEPQLLSQEQMNKGFESVLSALEDTTVDVPKAPEYVGGIFAKLVVAGVFSLAHVGKLLKEGGADPGSLLETGDALNVFGVVLDIISREKGEATMVDLYTDSKLNLEQLVSPADMKKAGQFEKFLEKKNLQCLYPMIPAEKYVREAIARNEPAAEILKWVGKNVPESISSEPSFFRMVMTEVLRHSVPLDGSGQLATPQLQKVLEGTEFPALLKGLLPRNLRASEANQRHYIVAVQLFADELGHPPGLVTALFSKLYDKEVISEQVLLKWKDDVKDSTPGRDKAIKETFNWFRWLESAPEAGGEDDE